MIVLLDNIRSLHNVGSIFRTADGAGVEKLYLCGITPSPLDRFGMVRSDVAKVALGAEKSLAWEQAKTTSSCIKRLKREGFTILALEQALESISIYKLKANSYKLDSLALVFGAEVEGITPSILKLCDGIIEIPMHGEKESLNVSVAFGVAAFTLRAMLEK